MEQEMQEEREEALAIARYSFYLLYWVQKYQY
jgi:hypothetical protein